MIEYTAYAYAAININRDLNSRNVKHTSLKSEITKISNVHNYISVYLQVSPVEKVRCGYKVLIMKEDTAISLHLDSGLVSVQKRTLYRTKTLGMERKKGNMR